MTYDNSKPHYKYVSIRSRDIINNNIERFHGTFKQREKVMKCFKANHKNFTNNFNTNYHFVKKHSSLGITPVQKVGIQQKAE